MITLIEKIFKTSKSGINNFDSSPFRNYLKQYTDKVEVFFVKQKSLVLVYIDIKDFHKIEQIHGSRIADRLLRKMEELLKHRVPEIIPPGETILNVDKLLGDEFIVIYTCSGEITREEIENISITWYISLKEAINKVLFPEIGVAIDLHVGCTAIFYDGQETVESKLYSAMREAQKKARGKQDPKNARMMDEFKKILDQNNFEIHYQPIVSLSDGSVLGWESLTRGPMNSHFRSPKVIFNFAAEVDLLYPLETACRRLALKNIGRIGQDQKIFININPLTVSDPNFVKGETLHLIQKSGLTQRNIVFEITEQADLRSLPHFKRTLEHYRGQGYMVAIDDAGAGFSSLQAIAQLRPDFIKMDMSLVRGVDGDPVKRALMETFVAFAEKIGCFIIAEGIETENELRTLVKMGVHYGQGYRLGRPGQPKSVPSAELCINIARLSSRSKQLAWRHSMPVADILEDCLVVSPETRVFNVKKMFESNSNYSGAVVVEEGRPLGLVMKQYMYGQLSTQYGVALYSSRPIKNIMDKLPLIVDTHTPVESVSQVAMSRERAKVYDHVIVTKNGTYIGVVTVQNLMNSLTRIQLEFAKGANPLTGLPGNNAIEEEIKTYLASERPFILVYLDLDNFKSYNDKYGFDQGDRLLLFTSKILTSVCRKHGEPDDFVGHLGGDDFILITSLDSADRICRHIIRYFDRLVPGYYSDEDRLNKGIMGRDREGREKWFPFISISMALVECSSKTNDINTISKNAADLKKYAKSLPGSVYVRDRRKKPRDESINSYIQKAKG